MIIGVDIDGVVADLHKEWLRLYNADYNDTLQSYQVNQWALHKFVKPECGEKIYDYFRKPDLYKGVPVIEGAKEGISWLLEQGNRVVYVSAAALGTMDQKYQWMRDNGFLSVDDHADENLVYAYDKSLIRVQVLIDDKLRNIDDFGGMGIIFDSPWNQGKSKRATSRRLMCWAKLPELWEGIYG